jgi:nucleoside-diphosphate-sugar epimerase
MRNLVTGGAGFLGSHLVNALVDAGDSVIIIDNLSTGYIRNLEHAVSSGRATFVYADVAIPYPALAAVVKTALRGPLDRIFHLASPAGPGACAERPWETLQVNAVGTMSLIDLALVHRARFLYASSCEVYGDPTVHPQPEAYFGNVDPIGPRSCYDEAKRFGEAAVAAAVLAKGLDGRVVRLFDCYGPAMDEADGRLIPELFRATHAGEPLPIAGSGNQTRSLIYVDDAIAMLRAVMDRPQSSPLRAINIGSEEEHTVEEIARAVARISGVEFKATYLPAQDGDAQRRRPDTTLARASGMCATTPLDDGLRATLAWLRNDRLAFA